MKQIRECYKQGIVALIPTYIKMKGDGTKILTGDKKEHYVYKNIKRVIKALAAKELLDLKESKKYCGDKLGCKNLVPIPLNSQTILIPIKTRKGVSKNDSAFSYINLKHIEEIIEDKRSGIVILKDKREIITRQRLVTIEKHITNGRLIEEILNIEQASIVKQSNFLDEYNAPATKADIIALRSELRDIKNMI